MALTIRELRVADDRTAFHSGDPDLDIFFAKYAGQNQFRHHIGTTYVAVDGEVIVGFATVAPGQVEVQELPAARRRKLPAYPLPVLRLARLAVASDARGRGVGRALLRHVLFLALEMSRRFGCVGVVVDAKPDAVAFYEPFGFSALDLAMGQMESRPAPAPLFLPLALVASALGASGHREAPPPA